MNHLPECKAGYPPLRGQGGTGPAYVYPCICPQLRACEKRVREEESRNVIGSASLAAIGEANLQQYQLGFSEGLDAARKAVGDLPHPMIDVECECGACAALSAIDALREKP